MTMATRFQTNGNGTQAWQRESVRVFFETIAWDGRSVGLAATGGESSGQSLMTMAVAAFFTSVPWEGQPIIAAPISPLAVQPDDLPSDTSLTLDAFSDLF